MSWLRGGVFVLLVGISCSVGAGVAEARESDPTIAAEALFVQGRELMEAGKFDAACTKFERSQQLDPGTGTLLNLALCYEKSDRLASAWTAYRAAAASARAAGQSDRETSAREAAEALSRKLARVTVDPTVSHQGLVVAIDGTEVPLDAWAAGIPADAGARVIVAKAPGFAPYETTITVRNGVASLVKVPRLERLPATGAVDEPAPASATAPSGSGAGKRGMASDTPSDAGGGVPTATLVLGGLGLAAGGVAAYYFVTARDQLNEVDRSVTERQLLIGNIAVAAGGAALVAAVVVWVLAPSSDAAAGLPVQVGIGPRQVVVGGSF